MREARLVEIGKLFDSLMVAVPAGKPIVIIRAKKRRKGKLGPLCLEAARGEEVPKYKVIAKAKDSRCPHVQVGDAIVMEGTMVNLEESRNVCAVALSAIQYSLFMMGKARDPKDFGRDQVYTLQCPDPETRVIFEVSRTEMAE